ncbi:MAG: EscU/YscU/HrcU family type III secretion system export apparatus switch protein, partial [Armatimonadota bacterium]
MATEERSEQPTPRKRKQAREKGQVATSVDLSRALGLLAIYLAWRFAGAGMLSRLLNATERWLNVAEAREFAPDDIMPLCADALAVMAIVLGPVMLAAMIGTAVAASAQTGGLDRSRGDQPAG